ncbi:MAG: glycosyltransferase 87 family protein [Solirubrobacterales bacterium]|nr:glycosyltransferase 87 family protein [Solirubrobacterales bacterium]
MEQHAAGQSTAGSAFGRSSGPWRAIRSAVSPRVALATYSTIAVLIVLAAPSVRALVPIGAPGSELPNWILGLLAPLSALNLHPEHGQISPILVVLTAIAAICMPVAWLLVVDGGHQIRLKTIVWTIIGLYALMAIAPPLLSTDVFSYLSGGRLEVLYGVNPYEHGPVVRPQDPIFGWTGLIWLDTPTVYGPLFTLLTAALTFIGPIGSLWALKVFTAACGLLCVWLTWSIAESLGRDPLPATLFVALNPLMLIYTAGGAHNDLVALALLLFASKLLIESRFGRSGVAMAAAIGVKATAGLALPFLIVGAAVRRSRGGWSLAGGFALGALAVALLGTAFYGLHWLAIPASIADGTSLHIGELHSFPGVIAGYLGIGPIGPIARAVLLAGVAVVVVLALRSSIRSRDGWISGFAVSMMALLVLSTQLHPNYVVLALPFAALSDDRRVRHAAVALTLGVVAIQIIRGILPMGVGWPHGG